jgi:acetyl-CoA carboxylase, biotin carboxylase subunit
VIRKVLIANRGEIALRIIRTLRDMGIESVAAYSEADRTARYVRLADEAYCIGPPPSSESYLAMDRIVETAKKAGADAVHPGYGFLSENAEFAELCRKSGLIFIGPPAGAIRAMGEKTQARRLMEAAGVPVVPGTLNALADAAEAEAKAEEVGYPVMLKAAAGGGGKGMRLVSSPDHIASAFRDAASEAESAFGDASVYLEKAVIRPRHIEMQIIGDTQGNVIWLGERECSIQRRHQKVIEEAPSPFVTEEMRQEMGAVAVRAAKAVNYFNAGTIEFLVDAERNFYFMEMNTRLQVEHAVTEDVTGLDLVRQQILVAEGKPLPFKQEDVAIRGWSIEARIYAEDPYSGFMPSPGKIVAVRLPEGPNVRVDSAVFPGAEISLYYDPMVAKVVTRGSSRQAAADVMRRALEEFQVVGIQTNRHFLQALVNHPAFAKGDLSTDFIPQFLAEKTFEAPANSAVADIAAAIYAYESSRRSSARDTSASESGIGSWRRAMDPWRG